MELACPSSLSAHARKLWLEDLKEIIY